MLLASVNPSCAVYSFLADGLHGGTCMSTNSLATLVRKNTDEQETNLRTRLWWE